MLENLRPAGSIPGKRKKTFGFRSLVAMEFKRESSCTNPAKFENVRVQFPVKKKTLGF